MNTGEFMSKVYPEPNTGCWLWSGASDEAGYGRINKGVNGHHLAHRLSYAMHNGVFHNKMHVLHKCDVRCCVNPDHLYLGDQRQNNLDRDTRGRSSTAYGSANGNSVLTEDLVLEIRIKYSSGKTSSRKLALEYRVSQYAIMCVINKKTWKHI